MTSDAPTQTPTTNGAKIDLKNLNWPTLILIIVSGGGNWWATQQNRTDIDYSRERVFKQVSDLHDALDDFEKRQKDMLESIHDSLRNQQQMLANQSEMLKELKK